MQEYGITVGTLQGVIDDVRLVAARCATLQSETDGVTYRHAEFAGLEVLHNCETDRVAVMLRRGAGYEFILASSEGRLGRSYIDFCSAM